MATRQRLLNASEVSDELGVDAETVRRWRREGKLQAVVLPSGRLRFRRDVVDALRDEPRPSGPTR